MHVSLTPELEEYVHDKVQTGRYNSASEVVREGLRLLEEQDQLKQIRIEELKKKIQVGLEDADAGRVRKFDAGKIMAKVTEALAAEK